MFVSKLNRWVEEWNIPGNGNLSTDIAKLGDETEDHVVLLVERALTDLVSELVDGKVLNGGVVQHLLRDLRELGDEKQHSDGDTSTGDGQVDELHIDEVMGVLAGEEELGGDQGTDERCNTVPGLAELQTG